MCIYVCLCAHIFIHTSVCVYMCICVCVGGGAQMSVWLGAADGFYQEDMSAGRNKSTCV